MIGIVKVKDRKQGNLKAHEIFKKIVDSKTLLALSGGTSVNYELMIVKSDDVIPGAICVVDERYGTPYHANSNELLIKNFGVLDYAQRHNIEFYKILSGKGFEQTAYDYDQLISELTVRFPKKIAVVGVGANLHTAGIFPQSVAGRSASLVVGETVDDEFPKRITLTFKSLANFEYFVILMFGDGKRDALRIMLDEHKNDIQKYPAVFYRKSLAKSFLITDVDI